MIAIGFVMGALTATFVILGTLYLFSQRPQAYPKTVQWRPAKTQVRSTYTESRS